MPNIVDDRQCARGDDAIGDYDEQLATTTNEFVAGMVRSAVGRWTSVRAKQRLTEPLQDVGRRPGTFWRGATGLAPEAQSGEPYVFPTPAFDATAAFHIDSAGTSRGSTLMIAPFPLTRRCRCRPR